MTYRMLADLTVVSHLLFVGFVVFGGFGMWRWPGIAWLHLPAVGWGVWIECVGGICPLTPFEYWLRSRSGLPVTDSDFLERFLLPMLYPSGLTQTTQVMLGCLAFLLNLVVYGVWWCRKRSGSSVE